uniref:Uncharacterized protein n=1 Tax=Panagrolaimus superbus TaxID=310955 RepID=A0A914ZA14_9BILA
MPIKETTTDIIEDGGDYYIKLYNSGGFLFHFSNRYEFKMFNLHTKLWSTHKNNAELHNFDVKDIKLIEFGTQRDKRGKTDFETTLNKKRLFKIHITLTMNLTLL